jgi:hypothetical protein
MSDWQYELDAQRVYTEARSFRNSYFERLAILNGGTVALVTTAVLGPLHATIRHKYSLAIGLTTLVFSMLLFLARNLLAAQVEVYAAGTTTSPTLRADPRARKEYDNLETYLHASENVGLMLLGFGMMVLVTQVWNILT